MFFDKIINVSLNNQQCSIQKVTCLHDGVIFGIVGMVQWQMSLHCLKENQSTLFLCWTYLTDAIGCILDGVEMYKCRYNSAPQDSLTALICEQFVRVSLTILDFLDAIAKAKNQFTNL